jgi:hypothetical protein
MFYTFGTRILWLELNISRRLVKDKFVEYFGGDERTIEERKGAVAFLIDITGKLQEKMVQRFEAKDTRDTLKSLYKIFDEVHHFYLRQKEARAELTKLNVSEGEIIEVFEQNRNIARNIIDATNIWIENCVLHQNLIAEHMDSSSFELDNELLIDMYIYGFASQAVSLISLSKSTASDKELFYGLKVTPNENIPGEVLKEHPIIYFNTLMTGNQNILSEKPLHTGANSTDFGIGFKNEYGVEFLLYLTVLQYFQLNILADGKYAFTIIDFRDFVSEIEHATNPKVNAQSIIDHFTLTKDKLAGQLRKNEPIIWVIRVNKLRHELCPFIALDNDRVFISYCALEQAKHLWVSFFSNGGMCYTNKKDNLTVAIEKRNTELSELLVKIIREKLQNHYSALFDEIDVDYSRIFGSRSINYGDFDLVFYSKEVNELFLIEAKFFSDSLTSSGVVTDYNKMFAVDAYYDHCRRRYDLVLREPDAIKRFVHAEGTVNAHFLFVSSKPLEIEFQDGDGIVTFLSLSIFDKYLEGKLISCEDDSVVRPIYRI